MTPFEKAKANVKHLADGLAMCNLIQQTIAETKGMTEEETDIIWYAILSLLESKGLLDDKN